MLSSVASLSVALAVTVILFVVLVAVGVKSFGANLSIFITFPAAYVAADCPVVSTTLAYIAWFLVNVTAPL